MSVLKSEVGQDYTIVDGVAEVPVKAAEAVDPIEKPISVTFKLSGWGGHLKDRSTKEMTVTLEPGQRMESPYTVSGFFGQTKAIVWKSSTGLAVTSGETVTMSLWLRCWTAIRASPLSAQ